MFTGKCQAVSSRHRIYLRNIHTACIYAGLLIMFLHLITSQLLFKYNYENIGRQTCMQVMVLHRKITVQYDQKLSVLLCVCISSRNVYSPDSNSQSTFKQTFAKVYFSSHELSTIQTDTFVELSFNKTLPTHECVSVVYGYVHGDRQLSNDVQVSIRLRPS